MVNPRVSYGLERASAMAGSVRARGPIPDPTMERERRRILLEGDVPSPIDPPSGCRFRTRCWKADAVCAAIVPPLEATTSARFVACHHPEIGPVML